MIKTEINVEWAEAALVALSRSLTDMTPVMEKIGEALVDRNQQGMLAGESPDGSFYAPRSPVTIARYQRLKMSYGLPLDVQGDMRNDIFHQADATEVNWGSNAIQAAVMQFGAVKGAFGTAPNGSSIPWGTIPARPFIGVSAEDQVHILDLLEKWLEGAADNAP